MAETFKATAKPVGESKVTSKPKEVQKEIPTVKETKEPSIAEQLAFQKLIDKNL